MVTQQLSGVAVMATQLQGTWGPGEGAGLGLQGPQEQQAPSGELPVMVSGEEGSPSAPVVALHHCSGLLSHFTVKFFFFFPLHSGQLERGRAVMTVQEVGEVGLFGLSGFL